MDQPITITGLGILSPLGIGVEETVAALREGEPALKTCGVQSLPFSPLCGEVPAFRIEEWLAAPKTYIDRNSELLLAAVGMALRHAGLDCATRDPERIGILAGTAWSGLDTMSAFFADYLQKGPRLVKPLLFPHAYYNTAVSLAAIEWSLRGPHQSFASGRAAAAQALIAARDLLADDEADVLLAGGSEALSTTRFHLLSAQQALLPEGITSAHIFDACHAGTIPGEAGVVLVLERRDHAVARGAKPLAIIRGGGLGPTGAAGAADAIRAALQEAGIAPAELACVCASANGCPALDNAEAWALRETLAGAPVPVIAPAALCGDTGGVCGALHAALAVLLRAAGNLPPVAGLATPAVPGLAYATTPATELRRGPILVLAMDLDGTSAALVLE